MPKRKKKVECVPGAPMWLVSYGDMTTLLLVFFILMFTTAEVDGQELKLILSSFTGSFGIFEGGLTLQPGPLAEMGQTVERLPSKQAGNNLSKALKDAQSEFKTEAVSRRLKISEDYRGLVITIAGQSYFKPDSAEITQKGKIVLEKIADLIIRLRKNMDNQVEIEGHSSREPDTIKKDETTTEIWERNLDLSTNRALNVEKLFIEKYIAKELKPNIIKKSDGKTRYIAKFIAKGYGEFEPLDDGDTPEARAWNRRVDIVIRRD